jgi:hypothetical protein
MNTNLLRSVAAALVVSFALPVAPAQAEVSKPDLIFVMPDDVGYGAYACRGNPILRAPSVDAFKKESLLFT